MPCADKEQDSSFEKMTISNSSKQHHDKDTCSPLCVCNCCRCQGSTHNIIYSCVFFLVKMTIDKKIPEYKSIHNSSFLGTIWQPPQIFA